MKAFVVPPLSRQQVPGPGVWPGELVPRTRSLRRLRDAQAVTVMRCTWPVRTGSFGGRSLGLPLAYMRN